MTRVMMEQPERGVAYAFESLTIYVRISITTKTRFGVSQPVQVPSTSFGSTWHPPSGAQCCTLWAYYLCLEDTTGLGHLFELSGGCQPSVGIVFKLVKSSFNKEKKNLIRETREKTQSLFQIYHSYAILHHITTLRYAIDSIRPKQLIHLPRPQRCQARLSS